MATTKRTTKKVTNKKVASVAPSSLEKNENVFARTTKSIAQLSVAIVAIVAVFSPENVWVLGPVIGSLAIMGIALGYFSSK
jgi:predicted NBD/HSP70 family sugar kinase